MKKHKLVSAALILFILSVPLSAMADNPVNKLKYATGNSAEYGAIFEEIMDQGVASVNDLLAMLRGDTPVGDQAAIKKDWAAKVTAMNLLGEMKAKPALDLLGDLLKNSDNISAIYNSGRAIGRIGGPNAFKILMDVLLEAANSGDELGDARKKAAILGLGLCEDDQAVSLLQDELNNPGNSETIRIYAAGSLGLFGINDGLGIVSAGLNSDDATVRLAAIRAIGIIGEAGSIAALNNMVGPDTKYVHRKAAQLSVAQIKAARMTGDEKVGFIKQELMKNSRDTAFIQWGTMTLKNTRSSAAIKALADLASRPGQEMASLRQAARIRMKSVL